MTPVKETAKVLTELEMLRGNVKELERRHNDQFHKLEQNGADYAKHSEQVKKTIEYLTKAFEKSVNDADRDTSLWATGIKSSEQAIKRLERQVELLSKELGTLRKDALTAADLKPLSALSDRIKKLEK